MKNVVFDRFCENWMQGGAKTREAFLRDLGELLQAERNRCVSAAEKKQSYSKMPNPSDLDRGWKRCAKEIADDIRDLR